MKKHIKKTFAFMLTIFSLVNWVLPFLLLHLKPTCYGLVMLPLLNFTPTPGVL